MKVSSHRGAVSQQDSELRQPDDERVVALHRATLTAIDFRLAPLFHAAPRSVFRDCYFDGADVRRVRLGQTHFERCTFDDARLEGARTEAAEFTDCRFAGRLDAVTFYGTPSGPEAKRLDPRRVRNDFRGNDFRDAELLDVAFVAGVDMDLQRFPDDELHVRIEDFRRRLQKARAEIDKWYERDRGAALGMLTALAVR